MIFVRSVCTWIVSSLVIAVANEELPILLQRSIERVGAGMLPDTAITVGLERRRSATKSQAQTKHQPSKAEFHVAALSARRSEEARACHSPFN